jgi:hypothetical protein
VVADYFHYNSKLRFFSLTIFIIPILPNVLG